MIGFKRTIVAWFFSAALIPLVTTAVAQPTQVSYQGQLRSGGTLFTGTASMKFAIVSGTTSLWSNDSTSVNGGEPTGSVSVPVSGGVFTVQLGAPPMKPLTASVFAAASSPVLRVWASTGGPFEQLAPDQSVTSAPFALHSPDTWSQSVGNVYRSTGNVGIGTSSPTSPLHVSGLQGQTLLALTGGGINLFGMVIEPTFGDRLVRFKNGSGNGNGGFDFYADDPSLQRSLLRIQNDGHIGIGTTAPSAPLTIKGTGLLLEVDSNNLNFTRPSNGNSYINKLDGGSLVFRFGPSSVPGLTVSPASGGTTITNVLQINGGSDLAEPFSVSSGASTARVESGMVMVIDRDRAGELRVASEPYDSRVAGVVSGANGLSPGLVMQSEDKHEADGKHPVALSGRVWCWVDASFGSVQPGDLLTTSSAPGMAMVARDPSRRSGAVLGKAMTGLDSGRGLVLVLVSLQ